MDRATVHLAHGMRALGATQDIEEEQLRPIFEEFGEIFELAVIRDRHTGAHRGCAFLTYKTKESGDMAIRELHNRLVLPKAHNPLQVGASLLCARVWCPAGFSPVFPGGGG
eukprot:scaffold707_cov240-Pinguiococcus_pyrenoidosus.AAC.17